MDCMDLHGSSFELCIRMGMAACIDEGRSAKGGSDQDDKEDFGEASGRSNGGPTEIRGPFWREIFGCVEDRIEIARKRDQTILRKKETIFEKRDRRIDRRRILCSQELGFVLFFPLRLVNLVKHLLQMNFRRVRK
jgi:hypothetical protein